jgi:IS5 family transposase
MEIRQSERKKVKIKLALQGSAGSGKTYSSLLLAKGLTGGDFTKIAIIDTENKAADLYADLGNYNVVSMNPPYSPERYIEAIELCERAGMEVIILDGISKCWDYLLEVHKEYADSVDKEGTWLKKRGKYHFGFKKHNVTDNEGLVLGVLTSTASKNEIANLEEVLETINEVLPKDIPLKADKGYQSKKNVAFLKKRNLKNHILKKAVKNKPLTKWEIRFNKLIGKIRFKVERTFGGIKLWFKGGIARYRGMKKMHTQNLMEAMCYNLYRSPGIFASNCKN